MEYQAPDVDFEKAAARARRIVAEAPLIVQPDLGYVNMAQCLLLLLEKADVSLDDLCRASAAQAVKSGFVGQTLPEFVALAHSELSEALEEHRSGRKPSEVHYTRESEELACAIRSIFDLHPEDPLPRGFSARVPCKKTDPGAKPEGIPSELADVVIRCCHYAGANGIDLAGSVREKQAYNATRPFKHGNKVI